MEEMHMRPGLFDAGEDHLQGLMALIGTMLKKTGHVGCMKGTIGCDAISAVADVSIDEDGNVHGLKEPVQLSPEEAAPLLDKRKANVDVNAAVKRIVRIMQQRCFRDSRNLHRMGTTCT